MDGGIRLLAVHLDGPHRAAGRLRAAQRLAGDHGAAVAAVYAAAPPVEYVPAGSGGGYVARVLLELEERRRADTRAIFQEVFPPSGTVHGEFIAPAVDEVVRDFAAQAVYADLLVLGQHDPDNPGTGAVPDDFPERALIASGRAGIVLPYAMETRGSFGRVLVAWKETAEAARAVAAALPILRRAAHVQVVAWGPARPRLDRPGLDLRRYLQGHGIDVQWQEGGPEPAEVGELLLSRAADASADLLVMGCYGHGRAREWIRGGATRTVLRSMTLPVLMAH